MDEIGVLLRSIVLGLPQLLVRPAVFPMFWILVFLVGLQYRRVMLSERNLYGIVKNSVYRQVGGSVLAGAVAGLLTSLVMAFLGASLTGAGVSWLLPLALLLMAVSPRLMCFSYAGGIVSIAHLLFGWPDVYIPSIMALVAVLHLAESVLIMLRGASCTTPVTVRHSGNGALRSGFLMQGFWPLPLLLLFVVTLEPGAPTEGLLSMPDWWPLIVPPPGVAEQANAIFTLFPVAAVLGYSDMAVSQLPRPKARGSAILLSGYSLILLALAVVSSHVPALSFLPALWGPFGHELVVRFGSRREFTAEPVIVPAPDGLAVFDVFPQGGAAKAGIRTGDVIRSINGRPVGEGSLAGALEVGVPAADVGYPGAEGGPEPGPRHPGVPVVFVREGREHSTTVPLSQLVPGEPPMLGIVPVPPPGTPPQLEVHSQGVVARWMARLTRRLRR